MFFKIAHEELLNTLLVVSRGLPNKTPAPILYTIKIEARDKDLIFTASNNEISLQVKVNKNIEIINPGTVCVQGKLLMEMVKKFEPGFVEFAIQEERTLVITSNRTQFKLKTFMQGDYPDIKFLENKNPIIIENETFKEIINQTIYACSQETKRPIIMGVNLVCNDNELVIQATDSYRLSRKKIMIESKQNFNITIPSVSLKELIKIVEGNSNDEDINIYIAEAKNSVLFKFNNIYFQTRLLEGKYPDIDRLLTENFVLKIPFMNVELQQACERISILSNKDRQESNYIQLTLRNDQIVEITSRNEELGQAMEVVIPSGKVETTYKAFTITFSSKYLIEALRSFNSSEITLSFTGNTTSFTIDGANDVNLISIILPVKLNR